MEDDQKKEQAQEESFRDEVEKFTKYLETNNKDLIKDIDLETLKRVADNYKMSHSRMEWYNAIEQRIKELESG